MRRPGIPRGADAERARLRAADEDGVGWRAWRVAIGADSLPGLTNDRTGTRLTIDLALGSAPSRRRRARPAIALRPVRALPSGAAMEVVASHHWGGTDAFDVDLSIEVACHTPDDVVVRLGCTSRGSVPLDLALTVQLHADPDAGWWLASGAGLEPDDRAVTALHLASGDCRDVQVRLGRGERVRPATGLDANAILGTRARESEAFAASLARRHASEAELRVTGASLARLLLEPPADRSLEDDTLDAVALAVADALPARERLLRVMQRRAADHGTFRPPIDAWATLRIAELEEAETGRRDPAFLERAFQLLLDDYARWMDRVDATGRNALQGGLIALDGSSESIDGTAWMGCYCVWMLSLAVELAREDPSYEDVAATFLEMALSIAGALDDLGGAGVAAWDEHDGHHHDVGGAADGTLARLPGRSTVGMLPLVAVALLPGAALSRLPEVSVRIDWSLRHQAALGDAVLRDHRKRGGTGDALVALVGRQRRRRALQRLDEWRDQLSPMLTVLLFDALDRIRVFERRSWLERRAGGDRHAGGPTPGDHITRWMADHLMADADDDGSTDGRSVGDGSNDGRSVGDGSNDGVRPAWVPLLAGAMRRAR